MTLTQKRIEQLTPIVRALARRFEIIGKHAALDVEDMEQEAWRVIRDIPEQRIRSARNAAQYISRSIRNHLLHLTARCIETVELAEFEIAAKANGENHALTAAVAGAIYSLPPMEGAIVRQFYGLDCARLSVREISDEHRCSVRRIKQILAAKRTILARHPLLKGRWQKASSLASA